MRNDFRHQSRLLLNLDRGITKQGLDNSKPHALLRCLAAIPVQLQRPQAIKVNNEIFFAGKIIKEGRLGNLHPLTQRLHRQRIERRHLKVVRHGFSQCQPCPGKLALP